MQQLIDRYLECWNATDPTARRELVADVFSEDVTYTDPLADVAGYDALVAVIGAVQQQFPGFTFSAVGEPDSHHGQVRFQWGLGPAGDAPPIIGFDVAVIDGAGKVATVLGFLDQVPAA